MGPVIAALSAANRSTLVGVPSPNIYNPPTPRSWWQDDRCAVAQAYVSASSEDIEAATTPANLFPPRFGYEQGALTVHEALRTDRNYPDNRTEFSGGEGGYTGTSRPSNMTEQAF